MKINYLHSICIFIIIFIVSCKTSSLDANLQPPIKTTLPKIDKATTLSDLSASINNLSKKEIKLLSKKHNLKDEKELNNLYNSKFLDSLKSLLNEKKLLQIDSAENFLLQHLTREETTDTIVISYLNIQSPTKGEVATYTYDVLAGDHIIYEITNGKHEIKNIEFIEGETTRLKLSDIKKRTITKGSFKIVKDNKLILNISNPGFFRNKGLLGSNVNIKIKKVIEVKGTTTKIVNDTTYVTKMVNKTINDTVYKLEDTKKFKLEPTINITKRNSFSFPIVITSTDKLIGWGYWIGTTDNEFESYKNAQIDGEETIISYAKQELKESKPNVSLPKYEGKDLEILILNQSLDSRTLNFDTNFAFYRTDNLIPRVSKKAEVRITNRSTIYDYTINYRLVTASIVSQNKMIETKIPVINKSILIQLPEND